MPSAFRPHVLVVDDEFCVREALIAALHPIYVVHTAASGRQALTCVRTHPVAAIILDAMLEEEHGLDLVGQLRALSSASILILTGYGTEELAVLALRAKVNDYLKKPVSLPALSAALERVGVLPGATVDLAPRARRYLDAHLAKRVCFADLAGELGVGVGYLRQCFRAAYGLTPVAYLCQVRMRYAAHLLRTTDRGIKEIVGEVGYASHTRFGRVFRAVHGVTPSAFRANGDSSAAGRGPGRPDL